MTIARRSWTLTLLETYTFLPIKDNSPISNPKGVDSGFVDLIYILKIGCCAETLPNFLYGKKTPGPRCIHAPEARHLFVNQVPQYVRKTRFEGSGSLAYSA